MDVLKDFLPPRGGNDDEFEDETGMNILKELNVRVLPSSVIEQSVVQKYDVAFQIRETEKKIERLEKKRNEYFVRLSIESSKRRKTGEGENAKAGDRERLRDEKDVKEAEGASPALAADSSSTKDFDSAIESLKAELKKLLDKRDSMLNEREEASSSYKQNALVCAVPSFRNDMSEEEDWDMHSDTAFAVDPTASGSHQREKVDESSSTDESSSCTTSRWKGGVSSSSKRDEEGGFFGYKVDDDVSEKRYLQRLENWSRRELGENDLEASICLTDGISIPKWLWEALYPHQQVAVSWLISVHTKCVGALIGDEMGLGKTIEVAAFLAALHHSNKLQEHWIECSPLEIQREAMLGSIAAGSQDGGGGILLVCPATVMQQWLIELNTWYPPFRVCVFHNKTQSLMLDAIEAVQQSYGVLLTTYETMRANMPLLLRFCWKYVVLDEGQKIRNPDAQVTLAAKQFRSPHRVVLSGSPIQNDLREFWSIFDFIYPGLLGTLPIFIEQFAEPIKRGGYSTSSRQSTEAAYRCAVILRDITQPYLLRRSKLEVQEQLKLPPKSEQVIFCHLLPYQYLMYVEFLSGQDRHWMTSSKARLFSILTILRKICNHPDILLLKQSTEDIPDDYGNVLRSSKLKVMDEILKAWKRGNHKVLVFCQNIQTLDIVENLIKLRKFGYLRMDGRTPVSHRHVLIQKFQGDSECFVMLLTTRVGGVGINLTGADRVLIFDPDWNPMTDSQARERCWRIGQEREVLIFRLISAGTVEEKIYHRQIFKQFLSQKVLNDPRQKSFFRWSDLQELLEVPPPPPDFDFRQLGARMSLREKVALKHARNQVNLPNETETSKIVEEDLEGTLSLDSSRVSESTMQESNSILKTLYDANGIKATVDQDIIESESLDKEIVMRESKHIAQKAFQLLLDSQKERRSHSIQVPTWTGRAGLAGAPLSSLKGVAQRNSSESHTRHTSHTERERSSSSSSDGSDSKANTHLIERIMEIEAAKEMLKELPSSSAVRRRDWSSHKAQPPPPCSRSELGILHTQNSLPRSPSSTSIARQELEGRAKQLEDGISVSRGEDSDLQVLPQIHIGKFRKQLTRSEAYIANKVLGYFLRKPRTSLGYSVTTGELLEEFAPKIADHHKKTFRAILKQMCSFQKSEVEHMPSYWILKPELSYDM